MHLYVCKINVRMYCISFNGSRMEFAWKYGKKQNDCVPPVTPFERKFGGLWSHINLTMCG